MKEENIGLDCVKVHIGLRRLPEPLELFRIGVAVELEVNVLGEQTHFFESVDEWLKLIAVEPN
jgi:hypothetical protein